MKCKLCTINDADKKGSHIVPAFILKTLFARDKEFVVSIGNEAVKNHIGRSLTTDKIQDYMGRELTDEEIEQNYVPFVEDHIFCKECEKRLGYLESIYSEKIHRKISSKECDINEIVTFEDSTGLISLFWYSVIFRYSINEHNVFKLKEKEYRLLRNYVHRNLMPSVVELKKHLENDILNNCPFPFGVFFNSNLVKKDTTNTVTAITNYKNPYFLFFNEYIIVLYHKATQVNGMKHSFFGLEKSYDVTNNINYDNQKTFNVCVVKNHNWEALKKNIFEFIAKLQHREYIDMFRLVASELKLSFSINNIKHFINRILYEDVHIADRYERTRVLTILMEEINKLPKL